MIAPAILRYSIASEHFDTVNSPQQEDGYWTLTSCEKYAGDNVIYEIMYGTAVYPLLNPVNGFIEYAADDSAPYLFIVGTFAPIYGVGETSDTARENWKYEFHKAFQALSAKLDWERTEEETRLWKILGEIVDIPRRQKLTPVEFQQIGKIVENRNISTHLREIEWLDESHDIIDCKDCPSGFLNYGVGQYFGANVLRGYETGKLLKICSISTTSYRDYSGEEIDRFVKSIPTSKELPISTVWK